MCPARPSQWPSAQAGRENPESLFFRQDLLPRGDNGSILLYQVAQGCTASGELWGLLGDFRTVGHPNTLLGDKVSLLASNSGLGGGALLQASPRCILETGEGGVWLQSVVLRVRCPPLQDTNSQSGERPAQRGQGGSHRGGPPVQHADVHAFLQVLLEEVVHL